MKLFFERDNFNNNRSYEKPIVKFTIYVYILGCVLLMLMNTLNGEAELACLDGFLNSIDEISSIFFKLKEVKFIAQFHQIVR